MAAHRPLMDFVTRSEWSRRGKQAGAFDFTFGNPQEMAIPGFAPALEKWLPPRDKDWYAYKLSEENAQKCIASSLASWRQVPFEAEDIAVTSGAFGALAAAFATFLDPGDEAVYSLPPWFGYEPMLLQAGAVCVKVPIRHDCFDLDLEAIEGALTSRTRMVIVNSPNNPTGKIYPAETLKALGDMLTHESERHGHPIYLLSDEPYSRLVFDGKPFVSPTDYYPYSMISYSYGKVLLTPGQRVGFLALPPTNPERVERREQIMTAQIAGGWLFPNALLQHAIADLDVLSIDLAELQAKRNMMVEGLRAAGYQVHTPEGAFYLLPKSPLSDDNEFARVLARHDLFVMPGTICSIPGYIRIALTASRDRLSESLVLFKRAREEI